MTKFAADDFDAIREGMAEKGLDGDFGARLRQQQKAASAIDRDLPPVETTASIGRVPPGTYSRDHIDALMRKVILEKEKALFGKFPLASELANDNILTVEKLQTIKRMVDRHDPPSARRESRASAKHAPLSGKPGSDCPIASRPLCAYGVPSLRGENLYTLRKLWRRASRDGDATLLKDIEQEAKFRGVLNE